jgi:hypothetical protein
VRGQVSGACIEQSVGATQVGEAVASLDQTTQQNAVLVEEMAATASSPNLQAGDLVQEVSIFKLAVGHFSFVSRSRTPAGSRVLAPALVRKPQAPAAAEIETGRQRSACSANGHQGRMGKFLTID